MSSTNSTVKLTVTADPHLARLVRMTAANVATLSSMSVDRVEDIRMAAEEAFVLACAVAPGSDVPISFTFDADAVSMLFDLEGSSFDAASDAESAVYADLILGAVCDSYEKRACPAAILMTLKADVR